VSTLYAAEVMSTWDYDGRPETDDERLGAFVSPERAREAVAKFLKANDENEVEWTEKWYLVVADPDTGVAGYKYMSGRVKNPKTYEYCYVLEYTA
jgi:hypothetical protein